MLHPQGISWVALAVCVPAGAQRVPGAGAGSWYGRTDGWGLSLEVTHGEPPQWCEQVWVLSQHLLCSASSIAGLALDGQNVRHPSVMGRQAVKWVWLF